MPAVMLEGPYAGMTEQDYEEVRAKDVRIAQALGWQPIGDALRDDEGGVPFYHKDLNSAWEVVVFVCTRYRYSAQQVFWAHLQELASEQDSKVGYPDVFRALVNQMPDKLCEAFLNAWTELARIGLCPFPTKNMPTEEEEFTKEDGTTGRRTRYNPPSGTPPWVHQSEEQS